MARRFYRSTGTVIKQTLAAWGISESTGCGCNEICIEMDRDTADVVEIKMEYYVDKMRTSIQNWRLEHRFAILQPPDFVIRELIKYGIKTSRAEEAEYQSTLQ